MSSMRYAVVGVGALGRHHARIVAGLLGVDLVAVAEPCEARGRSVAAACRTKWVPDYRELLNQVDAASIVVPTSAHRRVASEFLQRGIPVLIEKPLAGTLPDGEALVTMAEQRGTILQVGHVERFNPAFQAALDRTRDPKYIRAERLSPYAFRSMDIGAVLDLMIHDIELVLRLTQSELQSVEAFGVCLLGGQEDTVQARLRFADGCVADLVANRVCPEFRRTLQVWSSNGCVDIDLQTQKIVHYRPSPRLLGGELPYELAQQPAADMDRLKQDVFGEFICVDRPAVSSVDPLTVEIESFLHCVRAGVAPIVDGRAACKALRVADAILRAVAEHRWNGDTTGPTGCQLKHTRPRGEAA